MLPLLLPASLMASSDTFLKVTVSFFGFSKSLCIAAATIGPSKPSISLNTSPKSMRSISGFSKCRSIRLISQVLGSSATRRFRKSMAALYSVCASSISGKFSV